MTCKHLKELYNYCQTHDLRLSSMDLIHIACGQCGVDEECPSVLLDEYDEKHPDRAEPSSEEKPRE